MSFTKKIMTIPKWSNPTGTVRLCYHLALGVLSFLFLVHPASSSSSSSPSVRPAAGRRKLVIGVDGGTESIRACCFDAENGNVVGTSCAVAYPTYHPQPGWAEQDPADWYENLGRAVRGALSSLPEDGTEMDNDNSNTSTTRNGCVKAKAANGNQQFHEIVAICVDTTCCSVVLLDQGGSPLRHSLLWMDARSAPQTEEILTKCRGDPALNVNGGGEGPLSAEWMTPKSLWVQQNEPTNWERANTICEYQDYINYKLTGVMCASSCNAAVRWHWDGETCLEEPSLAHPYPGRPLSLYTTLGIPELAEKLPNKCLPMGALIGQGLTAEAAKHLNLHPGLPVVQGGPDAFVGMIGLGCIHPGQLCLITGSSHLHCVVTAKPTTAPGTWGAYRGAPLPGINFAEGGQSSTGSILRWAKNIFGSNDNGKDTLSYKMLDEEASVILPGSDGLVALETYQGSRTPITDPLARGAFVGLTLSHTRAHLWRSLLEAVCFGTRACVEGLSQAGHSCDEIVIAGGITRSPIWLQMHSDVTGKPVVVCENGANAPLLGCAILASVGSGVHATVASAVTSMVRIATKIQPDQDVADVYTKLFDNVYSKVSPAVKPIVHSIAAIRGGGIHSGSHLSTAGATVRHLPLQPSKKSGWLLGLASNVLKIRGGGDVETLPIVSPSLLASDWSNIQSEVRRCMEAGASHLHIDIFDGVYLDSPYAFTFGPQMVQAIRKSCDDTVAMRDDNQNNTPFLDLHICVHQPARFVKPMADSGADRFIFQWEAMEEGSDSGGKLYSAMQLAKDIIDCGMKCGISINPSTDVEDIYPLLETGLVDLVDILAVEPGFGGQKFQESSIEKIKKLSSWQDDRLSKSLPLTLMVDGGINTKTAARVLNAGANIVVAGTFLFGHPISLEQGIRDILSKT